MEIFSYTQNIIKKKWTLYFARYLILHFEISCKKQIETFSKNITRNILYSAHFLRFTHFYIPLNFPQERDRIDK